MSIATRALSIGSVVSAVIGGSLLHPYVTGATASTTHQGAPIGVGLVPSATAFIAISLLLGLLAYAPSTVRRVAGSFGSTVSTLAPRPSSFAAVVAALLLVSAAAGGGALGADAQRAYDHTSPVGDAEAIACGGFCIAAGVGIAVGMGAGYIASEYLDGDDQSSTYTSADVNETRVAVSNHADSLNSSAKTMQVVMSNQAVDGSRSVAWAKAKAAAIEALNAGENESVATQRAQDAVTEYYTTMEYNYFQNQMSILQKGAYLENVTEAQDGMNGGIQTGFIRTTDADDQSITNQNGLRVQGTATYTLLNGTQISYTNVEDEYSNQDLVPKRGSEGWLIEYQDYTDGDGDPSTYTWRVLIDMRNSAWEDIDTANSQMRSNADLYVGNLYANYNPGDINNSSIVDPTTLAQEFATDYNSTGYYAYAGAEAALMGHNGTFNESMTLVTSESSTMYNGSLFTSWSPASTNGTFETGHEYVTSNSDAPVFFATNDGLVLIQENFTLTEMVNLKTGEAVQNTTLQDYNRQTADVSLTEEQFQQLIDLRTEVEDAEAAAAGGGGSGGSQTLLLVAAAAGALALIARREGH